MTAVPQETDPPLQDDLAGRFRAGDEAALREAYDRYGRAVRHLATSTRADRSDAEDVTQATLVAAWVGRDAFDPSRGSLIGQLPLHVANLPKVPGYYEVWPTAEQYDNNPAHADDSLPRGTLTG